MKSLPVLPPFAPRPRNYQLTDDAYAYQSLLLRSRIPASSPYRAPNSPRVSLQTNTHKLLAVDRAIAIQIELVNHRRKLLLAQALAQLTRHAPQVLEVDLALAAFVEEVEGAQDFLARVAGEDSRRGEVLEGGEGEEQARRVSGGGRWVVWAGRGRYAVCLEEGDEFAFG